MKKFLSILYIMILLTSFGCFDQNTFAYNTDETKQKKEFNIDLEAERKVQSDVDKGHQPWRLDPVDVAYATIITMNSDLKYEKCHLASFDALTAQVVCTDTNNKYIILLKRLIKPKGIWTVMSLEICVN